MTLRISVICLILSATVFTLAFFSSPIIADQGPPLTESDFVLLRGHLQIPPAHQQNLLGRRVMGSNAHAMLMGRGMSNPEDHQMIHGEQPPINEPDYQVLPSGQLDFSRLFTLRAVPLPPTPGVGGLVRSLPSGANLQLDRDMYAGIVSPIGEFAVVVPKYFGGYVIVADAGRVHLKLRLSQPVVGNFTNLVMDLESTVLADAASMLDPSEGNPDDEELRAALPGLPFAVQNLEVALADSMTHSTWRREAHTLLSASTLKIFPGTYSGSYGPEPCLDPAAEEICYDASRSVVYNLREAADITGAATIYSSQTFGGPPGEELARQYSDGVDGFVLSGVFSIPVSFATPPHAPISSGVLSSLLPTATFTRSTGGFVSAEPTGATNNAFVDVVFDASNIRSVGLSLQNGTTHAGAGSTAERRGFRMIAFDASGGRIQTYNWYTYQDDVGFYGMTSPEPISRLRLRVSGSDDFTFDDLTYSRQYLGALLATDPAGSTLKANLGWRADGTWEKKTTGKITFGHPYFNNVSSDRDMRNNLTSTTGRKHSGETYWRAAYGGGGSSHLESPAFTLSNLPLILDKDVAGGSSVWHIGKELNEADGFDDSAVSSLRIPEDNAEGTVAITVAATNYVELTIARIGGLGPGDPIRVHGPGIGEEYSEILSVDHTANTLTLASALTALASDEDLVQGINTVSSSTTAADELILNEHKVIPREGTGVVVSGGTFSSPETVMISEVIYGSPPKLVLHQALSAVPIGGESVVPLSFAEMLEDSTFHFHESTAAMNRHWSHVHWQACVDIDEDAVVDDSADTERYVEYSTDNGHTWREAWWWKDESHRGKHGEWWQNHMHPYSDSDMHEEDWNGNGSINTDFDKDGTDDYASTNNNDYDAAGNLDSDDDREWDTEFYMDYVEPDLASLSDSADAHGHHQSITTAATNMEGVSIIYRFRFVDAGAAPASCAADGVEASCFSGATAADCDGWMVDDVAFNSDTMNTGYYTSFDGSYDSSLQ